MDTTTSSVLELADKLACDLNAKAPLVIECSSRSYNLADSASDHDVKCITVRPERFYVRVTPYRDVYQRSEGDIDVVAWDFAKFLQLLAKSNPSTIEWLTSPLVFRNSEAMAPVKQFAKDVFEPRALAFHYLGMAKKHDVRYLENHDVAIVKRSLHAVRAILAARFVIDNREPAPHDFDKLVETSCDPSFTDHARLLAALKRTGHKSEQDPNDARTKAWLASNMAVLTEKAQTISPRKDKPKTDINELFRSVIDALY